MKAITSIITGVSILACAAMPATAADDLVQMKKEAAEAINAFKKTDSSLEGFFKKAVGYAIFPSIGKGGLVVGGAHGTGLVYEKEALIGKAALTKVTVGAQAGGQVFRELIFFETQAAMDQFKQSNYEMNAQVSAVAAAEGASKNAKYRDGVLVFTKPVEGLMVEATVGGQKFKFEPIKE